MKTMSHNPEACLLGLMVMFIGGKPREARKMIVF